MSRARNRADANVPDDSITSADLAPDIVLTGGSVGIPSVTTANLPGTGGGTYAAQTATNGMLVYNSTLGMLQQRASGIWSGITTAPVITSFQYSDGAAATAEKTVVGLASISCTTQTSTTVLVPGASLGIQVGMVVAGTGIPAGTTVVSVILDTSFVISAAATASATVTLTFGGAVTITGSNFDSILAGGSANVGVTFDGTSATSISVNSLKTIITCTPPAHAAGTITMQVINASGLTAETNFVYDEEAIFTTAAGSIGGFVEGTTFTANASAPRIEATDGEGSPSALTTGFDRVTSAADDTVITTTIGGLTLLTSGYLTGDLVAASNATTYPFYATAKDSQNQRTAPRLFNIISYDYAASGGTIIEPGVYTGGGYRSHTFLYTGSTQTFTVNAAVNVDYLVVAGGGGGGKLDGGGGGAGGFLTATNLSLTAGEDYTITVGDGGAGRSTDSTATGTIGGNSSIAGTGITTITSTGGGGGGSHPHAEVGGVGGSGGGTSHNNDGDPGGGRTASPVQGNIGGAGFTGGGSANAGGGGGGAGEAGNTNGNYIGGDGLANSYRTGSPVTYAGGGGGGVDDFTNTNAGGDGGGGHGSRDNAGTNGTVGVDNFGGGGGGGGYDGGTGGDGFAGGSGIVIIRYATT